MPIDERTWNPFCMILLQFLKLPSECQYVLDVFAAVEYTVYKSLMATLLPAILEVLVGDVWFLMRSEQELSNDAEEKNRHHLRCIRLNSIDDLFLTWRLFFDSFDQTIVAPFCWLRTTAISTQAGSVLPNVVLLWHLDRCLFFTINNPICLIEKQQVLQQMLARSGWEESAFSHISRRLRQEMTQRYFLWEFTIHQLGISQFFVFSGFSSAVTLPNACLVLGRIEMNSRENRKSNLSTGCVCWWNRKTHRRMNHWENIRKERTNTHIHS